MATADGMSHFFHGFYLRGLPHLTKTMGFEKAIEKGKEKLERDFNKKIFFDEAREKVRERYNAWKIVLDDLTYSIVPH